ncbi:ATP-binding protein [Salarchaeum sp. III]|uniref:PAS domain-containing sensor histidine kinase n=1 Tax=Salarchaeum sp. III TaxID=3107927 RepID=UPI002ED9C690
MKTGEDGVSYEVIAEGAPLGLLVLDEDGTIEWTNEGYADVLDVPRKSLIGTPFVDLVDDGYYDHEVVERYIEAVRDLLSSSNDIERTTYLVHTHRADETLVHRVSTTLLPLDDEEFAGTLHAFRDVTTQMTYERELKRQNDRLDEFASVVSHDLRNPLTVAQGYLEVGRENGDDEAFERVERAHERMETLIDDLLSLAKSGERVTDTTDVDIDDLARDAWSSVETGAATLDVTNALPRIEADRARLRQLLENLFRNAVEHGSTAPRTECGDDLLTVRVGALGGGRGFYVADNGPGIPADERDAVFDRGYTTAADGTGLGLNIVETIADAHGWTVEATESDDGGARFEVETTERVPL